MTTEKNKNIIIYIVLILIFFITVNLKLTIFKQQPMYDSKSDVGLFTTESAFQYRYAKMVSEAKAIPSFDKKAQWPEGIKTFSELTVFMEYVCGITYRIIRVIFPSMQFHVFIAYFLSIFTSLVIIAVFLGVKITGADKWTLLFVAQFMHLHLSLSQELHYMR